MKGRVNSTAKWHNHQLALKTISKACCPFPHLTPCSGFLICDKFMSWRSQVARAGIDSTRPLDRISKVETLASRFSRTVPEIKGVQTIRLHTNLHKTIMPECTTRWLFRVPCVDYCIKRTAVLSGMNLALPGWNFLSAGWQSDWSWLTSSCASQLMWVFPNMLLIKTARCRQFF